MQVRNDSVSCIQRRVVICKYATIVYLVYNDARLYASMQRYYILYTTTRGYMQVRNDSVSCILRREVICEYATIVYLVYNDARLYASTQR